MSDTPPLKKENKENVVTTTLLAVLLALCIRTFLFEPFNIPSGSMIPNLLVGDYLFVSKYSYGYSRHSFPFGLGGFDGRMLAAEPKRGDVIVFKLPSDTGVDYIKRLVALPGETVQMKQGRLYINDKLIERKRTGSVMVDNGLGGQTSAISYIEILPDGVEHEIYEETDSGPLDNTEKFVVPDGHYFFMGDNRDNSRDSRVSDLVGYVPFDNLVGKARFLFFSSNGKAEIYEPWKWPFGIRYERLFNAVK
jgi:signal peptidase I